MSIDISYNNSINCFNLLLYLLLLDFYSILHTLVNVFQYIYICRLSIVVAKAIV